MVTACEFANTPSSPAFLGVYPLLREPFRVNGKDHIWVPILGFDWLLRIIVRAIMSRVEKEGQQVDNGPL